MQLPASSLRRRTAFASLLTVVAVSGGVALADPPTAPAQLPGSGSTVGLPAPANPAAEPFEVRGTLAVDVLDAYGAIDDVAARASMEPTELIDQLLTDPTMFVTNQGMVGFAEPPRPDAPAGPTDQPEVGAIDVVASGIDVLDLHSRPGATRKVLLDVDGHTTVNDWWNSTYGIPEIVSAPYGTDGDPAFSASERQAIYDIWEMVADDFAPFDIDVTTDDPGPGGLARSGPADTTYGTRVVITPSDWYFDSQGSRIGGIALINVFSANFDHSAFVFSSNLGSGWPKFVAEAASHEAGHNFGLYHDGKNPSTAYYAGHGDWAPIMGVGYSEPITQWSKGEYSGANNTEDDLADILSHAPAAPDDHGNTVPTATSVGNGATAVGSIAVNDVDVFTVTVGAGPLQATVTPTGDNLHASVTVRNLGGSVVASASPLTATGWTATASATVPAGTYSVTVAPVGWLTADTGFTAYASLGGYQLTVNGAATGATTTSTTTTSTTTTSTTSTTTSTTTTTTSTSTSTTSTTATSTTAPATSTTSTSTTSTTAVPGGTTTTTTTVPLADPVNARAGFMAMAPTRLVDTRIGVGGSTRLPALSAVPVQVAGRPGIPADATAAVVTVTAVTPASFGFLSVYPCDGGAPDTSAVNYAPGEVRANTTIATLDGQGRLCVWTLAPADVLVDITGWLAPGAGSRLTPVGPIRVADTRTELGGSDRLAAGGILALDLTDHVWPGATAVALNVTAVNPASAGFLTVYPCGTSRPATSTVNHPPGVVLPNNTIVGLGAGDRVCVYSLSPSDVLVDLVGVFSDEGLGYVPATPERLLDTRDADAAPGPGASVAYSLGISPDGPPAAASVNVTAVGHTGGGFVSTYACGPLPDTSTLNLVVGEVAANGAIVPASSGAVSCVYTLNGGDVLVDLAGWWV